MNEVFSSESEHQDRVVESISESALDDFGVAAETIERFINESKRPGYGKTICSCGHSVSMHSDVAGTSMCRAGKMYCPCMNMIPVLEVADKRCFMFKSEGLGGRHALLKGILMSKKANKMTRLITDRTCFKCKTFTNDLIPVGLNRDYQVVFGEAPLNGLFCVSCTEGYLGRPISGFLA